MATFEELQTRVREIVIDLPAVVSSRVPTLINEAIRHLQTKHDFKVMEAETAGLITTLHTRLLAAQPADWLRLRARPKVYEPFGKAREIAFTDDPNAADRDWGHDVNAAMDKATVAGAPKVIVHTNTDIQGAGQFLVWPLPDGRSLWPAPNAGEYRIVLPYWKSLPKLVNGGDTNWFTLNAEEWIIYQAAAEGFMLDWDHANAAVWFQNALRKYNDIVQKDKLARIRPVDTLVPHSGARGSRINYGDY